MGRSSLNRLNKTDMPVTRERVIEELETIMDPELGLDVWTLGLIYDISFEEERYVKITMTYTTPLCPYGPALKQDITDGLHGLGFKAVEIEVTFNPPWTPSEQLRVMMGV